jgi:branched-chain amino acid aminotransferase
MYYSDDTIIYLDGKWTKAKDASLTLYNQSLHYGNAVFEGIRSYETEDGALIFKAKEHFDRLHFSAEKMQIPLTLSSETLTKLSYELLEKNNLTNAYIRPLIYPGENMSLVSGNDSHVLLCAWEWGRYLGDHLLRLMTSTFQRPNPKACFVEAKVTGHYTNSILATTEAKQKGFDEALLLDSNGYVAEGPGANFFFEKNEVLYTPKLGNILPGITRQTIFELADEMGIEVRERQFKVEDVYAADGAFFTGTAAEVAGIESLDGKYFSLQWPDTIGYELSRAYNNRVQKKEYKNFELV